MPPYDVFMHLDLLDAVPGSGMQRRQVIAFLRHLRKHPDTLGDFIDKDTALRDRQVKIVGGCAVTYWTDDAVRAVMVVDIQLAGR